MMVFGCGVLVGGLGGEIPIMLWAADRKQKVSDWAPSVLFCGLLGSALASGVWSLLFWRLHPVFLRGISTPLATLLLGSIPFSILGTFSLAFLVGLDRLRERSVVIVLNQFVNLAATCSLFYILQPTAEVAFTAFLIGLALALLTAGLFLKADFWFRKPQGESAGRFAKIGAALNLGVRGQLGNVATFFNYRLDVFVVNYYLNTSDVGLYTLGVMVSEALWQVPNAAAMALIPRTVRETEGSRIEFTCMVCRQVFAVACLMALVVAATCTWVIPLIFGARFKPSVPVIWWILPGTVALAVAKVMCSDLLARGMPEYATMFAFTSLVITVSLDLILIPHMGIQGAALASSVAYLTNSLLVASVLKRKLRVTWRALYIPSKSEFGSYRQALGRVLAWLQPTPTA